MDAIADKLASFDADIQFMGLEDLDDTSLMTPDAAVPAKIVRCVVTSLATPNYSVQSRATKVFGSLARAVDAASLGRLLFDDASVSEPQRGLALKRIFQNTPSTTSFKHAFASSYVPSHPASFSTAEGCDASFAYMERSLASVANKSESSSQTESDVITQFYFVDHKPPAFSHGFDLSALCIPHISADSWHAEVKPRLQASLKTQRECLGMSSKMAESPRASESKDEIKSVVSDVSSAEASAQGEMASRILTVFAPRDPDAAAFAANSSHLVSENLDAAEESANSDERDDADALYDDMDFEEGFEDGFHSDNDAKPRFSNAFQIAAAQLAAAAAPADVANKRLAMGLVSASARDLDDSVERSFYISLRDLIPPGSTEFSDDSVKAVRKDISRSTVNLAKIAGISLMAHIQDWKAVNKLVSFEIQKHRSRNSPQIVSELKDGEIGPSQEQRNELNSVIATVLRSLGPTPPRESVVTLASLIQRFDLTEQLPALTKISQQAATPLDTRIPALLCAASLVRKDTPQAVVDMLATQCEGSLTKTNSYLGEAISALTSSPQISPECAVSISKCLESRLRENSLSHLTDADLEKAFDSSLKLPVESQDNIEAILHSASDNRVKERVFAANIPKSIESPVVAWAVEMKVPSLISSMAAQDSRVLPWAYDFDDVEVHAAASGGSSQSRGHERAWMSLADARYRFSQTKFEDLSTEQSTFLKLLVANHNHNVNIYEWYSVDDMVNASNANNKSDAEQQDQAILLGKQSAAAGGSENVRVSDKIQSETSRISAFQAFVDTSQDAKFAFVISQDRPWLRKNFTGTACITSASTASEFARTFETDPEFVVATARYLDIDIVAGMNDVLSEIVFGKLTGESAEGSAVARAQALSIMKRTVAKDTEGLNQLLRAINAVLKPDSSLVNQVTIGPFKMEVDDLDTAREVALDSLSVCIMPEADRGSLGETVSSLAEHRLKDNSQRTRLRAYRILSESMDLDYGWPIVEKKRDVINNRIEKQLASPPKENTASWTSQEAQESQLSAEKLRAALLGSAKNPYRHSPKQKQS